MFEEKILKDCGSLVWTNHGWRPKTLCDIPKKEFEKISKKMREELARKLRRKGS